MDGDCCLYVIRGGWKSWCLYNCVVLKLLEQGMEYELSFCGLCISTYVLFALMDAICNVGVDGCRKGQNG